MGATFQQGFPELVDDVFPMFEKAKSSGLAAIVSNTPLMTTRNGYLEETYFDGNFVPLRDIDGSVGGFYNSAIEVTTHNILQRRSSMLEKLNIPYGQYLGSLADYVIPALESNIYDITMALLYEIDEEKFPDSCHVFLRGRLGVPADHELIVEEADLSSDLGLIPLFQKAKRNILSMPIDHRFEAIKWRGFGEPSKSFSILPLSTAGRLFGFLVLGANPRRAIDVDHYNFMVNISTKVSGIAASIVTAEEARRRAERLERELQVSERQIRYMAQHASVGMQHLDLDGNIIWANDQYYELTGHRPEQLDYALAFKNVYLEEDRPKAVDAWRKLRNGEPNVAVELRLKRTFIPPLGPPEPACILSLSFPYMEKGMVKSIMTCTTDVSQLKWAEASEARQAAEARAAKKRQEDFVDVISHEMRNPLSAIFHCADMIQTSFDDVKSKGYTEVDLLEALHSNVDSARTILMCANHQKRIVDDVLTLSKLEYMMLSLSPRPTQPVNMIDQAVRMFEATFKSHDIKITITPDPSLEANGIDWILCDPSRVGQILINLLTNAIKFTCEEPKREISIKFGVSLSEPRQMLSETTCWAPNDQAAITDGHVGEEWGDGESLFLYISIEDTGVGMTPEEIIKLFHRFRQASSRTSIRYGGSGLGLFISKKLTEKQGGEIGVASELGKGSTFAFYIKARRTDTIDHMIGSPIHHPDPGRLDPNPKRVIQTRPDVQNTHVLLVEDNLVNQKVLSKQLTKAGCVVYIANHGVEALDFIQKSNIWHECQSGGVILDIILMDWEMPIMDGLTCSREIRQLQKDGKIIRHVNIIATTANVRAEQIQRALASGVVSFLSFAFTLYSCFTTCLGMNDTDYYRIP